MPPKPATPPSKALAAPTDAGELGLPAWFARRDHTAWSFARRGKQRKRRGHQKTTEAPCGGAVTSATTRPNAEGNSAQERLRRNAQSRGARCCNPETPNHGVLGAAIVVTPQPRSARRRKRVTPNHGVLGAASVECRRSSRSAASSSSIPRAVAIQFANSLRISIADSARIHAGVLGFAASDVSRSLYRVDPTRVPEGFAAGKKPES